MTFWNAFSHDRLIAAHRGNRSQRAENTISAFEASIGLCDFVELDIGFSKDAVAIVMHDDTLLRTSNAEQISSFHPPYNVADYTYQELLSLDVSSWANKVDSFESSMDSSVTKSTLRAAPAQSIPTLLQALEFFKLHDIPVNIEIKNMTNTAFDKIAVQSVVSSIQELQMQEKVLLSSFNHNYMIQAKDIDESISRAAIQENRIPSNIISYLKDLGVGCYNIDIKLANKEIIQLLTNANIKVGIFTVNDPKEKEKMFDYGASVVYTDVL